jgi:hypothetical protein
MFTDLKYLFGIRERGYNGSTAPRLIRRKTMIDVRTNSNCRDRRGRFAQGNAGGPGRPPIEKERRYIETMAAVCDDEAWRRICKRAVKDAEAGDHRAREWLTKHLVGEPRLLPDVPARDETANPYLNADPELLLAAREAFDRLNRSCDVGGCD